MVEVLRCYFLTPEEARQLEGWYRPLLEKALKKAEGRYSWDEFSKSIREAKSSVWVVTDLELIGAFTLAIHHSGVRWAEIELLAGEDFERWFPIAMEAVEKYLKHLEVKQLVFYGSKALMKLTRGFNTQRIEAVKYL